MIKHFYKAVVFTGFIALIACADQKEGHQEGAETSLETRFVELGRDQIEANHMKLVGLTGMYIPKGISCSGLIDVPPQNRATISPLMDGYVKDSKLLVGDRVEKGQVLALLENPEYITLQQQYLELNERLAYLEAEYQRQITLREENISSKKSYLKAESEYKSSLAMHKGLESRLRMLAIDPARVRSGDFTSTITLRAPISGRITSMNLNKGLFVRATDKVMEIVSSEHMHLELNVYEKDVLKIRPGQPLKYRIPEASTELFSGNVHLVGTALGDDRSIKVHGHLDDETGANFLVGMFVEATIVTDSIAVMALPSTALLEQGDEAYVLRFEREEGDRLYFSKVAVQAGERFMGMRAVDLESANYLDNAYLIQSLD